MTEQALVKKCLTDIYRENGYEDLNAVTQRDHEHISHQIETSTGTLISVSTIKRLLNGDFSRLPQTATLNALSNYSGYKSWQEYKASKRDQEEIIPSFQERIKTPDKPSPQFKRLKLAGLVSLGIGVAVIAAFIGFSSKKPASNFDEASFSARKNTSNEIPNTVVFHYNVDEVNADSFFIQQSWDANRRVKVFKNNYTLTDIYYVPGYHTAKLIANDSIIKTVDVSIPTDRWFLSAKGYSPGSIPEYIKAGSPVKNGSFSVSKEDLIANQIDTQRNMEYAYTYFPSKMTVSSDQYSFKTKVRVNEVRNNFCPFIMLEIFCQRNFMFFESTSKGCSSETLVQFGEQFISGKKTDLSSLGHDVTHWMNFELVVNDKNVKITLDGKEVFSSSYQKSSGLITGLGFISNGLCEVDFVELKGANGELVYQNDFNVPAAKESLDN